MRALKNYGSMLVISSNRQLSRLIEDGEFGFRNIAVIVDMSGATDDVYNDLYVFKICFLEKSSAIFWNLEAGS